MGFIRVKGGDSDVGWVRRWYNDHFGERETSRVRW